jgi:putative addiction module component (TIGR02574 family)
VAVNAKDICVEALALGEEARAELVRLLSLQRDGRASAEIEKAWMEEIERREKEYADGKMESIPAEDVFRELRNIAGE